MAALAEGTYVIINVNCGKAIDVVGDDNNSNVQIWSLHYGDGQIWNVTKPEGDNGRYQLIATLSGKSMSVDEAQDFQNVKQYDDTDNLNKQRWEISEVSGETYIIDGVPHQVYTVRIGGNTNLGLDVEYFGTEDGSNIALHGIVPTANQKWLFLSVPVLTDGGYYKIGIANDTSLRCGIASESTSEGETLNVVADSDSTTQIFFIERDSNSGAFRFVVAHSSKVLDWDGDYEAEDRFVYQASSSPSRNTQWWLPTEVGGIVNYQGTKYPKYRIRSRAGHNKDLSIYPDANYSDKRVYIHTRLDYNTNQYFFFIRTEGYGNDIPMPGPIRETNFSRDGGGAITIGTLSFASKETKFQGRYKVRRYKKDRTQYVETDWMNIKDNSTSRSGWGTVFVPTFTSSSTSGIVSFNFNKTIRLDTTYQFAEVYVEIRTYTDNYKGSYAAFGATARSTLYVSQIPTIGTSAVSIGEEDGALGIKATLSDSLGAGCQMVRARIYGSDGRTITKWLSGSSMELFYPFDTLVNTLPRSNEVVTIKYMMLTADGASITGTLNASFSVTIQENDPSITLTYANDDSYTAIASCYTSSNEYCYIEVKDIAESSFKPCLMKVNAGNISKWTIVPPLNRTVRIIKMDSANGSSWTIRTKEVKIDSHFCVWNWSEDYALLLVNPSKPPQQTRSFNTAINFSTPSGRTHPVAFASYAISSDFTVSGVVVDTDVNYLALGSMPSHATVDDISKLVLLSGQGIHPIYRTPYGDWYTVGIEGIDISRLEYGYSKADVKQRIVED